MPRKSENRTTPRRPTGDALDRLTRAGTDPAHLLPAHDVDRSTGRFEWPEHLRRTAKRVERADLDSSYWLG